MRLRKKVTHFGGQRLTIVPPPHRVCLWCNFRMISYPSLDKQTIFHTDSPPIFGGGWTNKQIKHLYSAKMPIDYGLRLICQLLPICLHRNPPQKAICPLQETSHNLRSFWQFGECNWNLMTSHQKKYKFTKFVLFISNGNFHVSTWWFEFLSIEFFIRLFLTMAVFSIDLSKKHMGHFWIVLNKSRQGKFWYLPKNNNNHFDW